MKEINLKHALLVAGVSLCMIAHAPRSIDGDAAEDDASSDVGAIGGEVATGAIGGATGGSGGVVCDGDVASSGAAAAHGHSSGDLFYVVKGFDVFQLNQQRKDSEGELLDVFDSLVMFGFAGGSFERRDPRSLTRKLEGERYSYGISLYNVDNLIFDGMKTALDSDTLHVFVGSDKETLNKIEGTFLAGFKSPPLCQAGIYIIPSCGDEDSVEVRYVFHTETCGYAYVAHEEATITCTVDELEAELLRIDAIFKDYRSRIKRMRDNYFGKQ